MRACFLVHSVITARVNAIFGTIKIYLFLVGGFKLTGSMLTIFASNVILHRVFQLIYTLFPYFALFTKK